MYAAAASLAGPLHFTLSVSDNLFNVTDAANAMRQYASEGYNLIIAHGSQYGGTVQQLASQFPKTSFAWGTAGVTYGLKNVFAYQANSQEGGYVEGYVAAKLSKSKVLGVIGPINVGDAHLYVVGFKAGALAADPTATVHVSFTGSFSDDSLMATAAKSYVSEKADVLTGSSQSVVGAIGVAKSDKVAWFGTQWDQASLAPTQVVASPGLRLGRRPAADHHRHQGRGARRRDLHDHPGQQRREDRLQPVLSAAGRGQGRGPACGRRDHQRNHHATDELRGTTTMTAPAPGSGAAGDPPFLQMRGITKRFPGVLANDHVDFDVVPGEIHALFGENGAGKSTLMRILYGLYQPDEGEIRLRGEPVAISSPAVAIQRGIGMIHQHFMLVQTLTVAENVALGVKSSRGPLTDLGRVSERIRELSETYGLKVDPAAYIWQLSVGERQRVEIIKALYREVSLLVLDEPTAVLTPHEVRDLFAVLSRLVRSGLSLVFISHKVTEVLELSDRITVLRGGRKIATVRGAETTMSELADMMVGHEVTTVEVPLGPAAAARSRCPSAICG